MRHAETVTFGGSGLDRAAELRGKPGAVAELLGAHGAGVLPVWRGKPLMRWAEGAAEPAMLPPGAEILALAAEPPVLLGRGEDGTGLFAADVSSWEPGELPETLGAFHDPSEQPVPGLPEDHRFAELRACMMALDARGAELASTARAVLGWHAIHRFCARCGAPTAPVEAGWQRACAGCGGRHFPRTDPVVIMLVTRGNSVLVGRSPGWPEGMYSLLAGFVEPGETIEAAVRREVFEESGVRVGAVRYLASQPWPFPASLMLGCEGVAESTEIVLDPVELEDARWMTREEMAEVFEGRHPEVRPAREGAIAHFLMANWLADSLD
jgi:NAD+ diphosphatase